MVDEYIGTREKLLGLLKIEERSEEAILFFMELTEQLVGVDGEYIELVEILKSLHGTKEVSVRLGQVSFRFANFRSLYIKVVVYKDFSEDSFIEYFKGASEKVFRWAERNFYEVTFETFLEESKMRRVVHYQ